MRGFPVRSLSVIALNLVVAFTPAAQAQEADGLATTAGGLITAMRGTSIGSSLPLDSAPVCGVSLQATSSLEEWFPAESFSTRPAPNGCSAENGQALRNAVPAHTCVIIAALATAASDDIDLAASATVGEQTLADEDTFEDHNPIVVLCNDSDAASSAINLRSRVYRRSSAAAASAAIVRFEVPAANFPHSDRDGNVAPTPDMVTSGVNALVELFTTGRESHPVLSELTLAGFNADNMKVCQATMGAIGSGYQPLVVSERSGSHGCSAADAQAISAPLAAGTCSTFVMQGLVAMDIDLKIEVAGVTAPFIDEELDNRPVINICNSGSTPANITISGNRLGNPANFALVSRVNFAVGSNNGRVSDSVLSERAARRSSTVENEAAQRLRQVVSGVIANAAEQNITISSNVEELAFCGNSFDDGEAGSNDGFIPLAPAARTASGALNSCSAAQASAITAPIAVGQCAIIVAHAVDPRADIDLRLVVSTAMERNCTATEGCRLNDEDFNSSPLVLLCNGTRAPARPQMLGRFYGEATQGLVTRINFAAPRARRGR